MYKRQTLVIVREVVPFSFSEVEAAELRVVPSDVAKVPVAVVVAREATTDGRLAVTEALTAVPSSSPAEFFVWAADELRVRQSAKATGVNEFSELTMFPTQALREYSVPLLNPEIYLYPDTSEGVTGVQSE